MAEPTDWERTARELAQVCEAQAAEIERLRADAELGAMVRRMPEAYSLEHAAAHMPEAWVVRDWMDTAMAVCDTPDAVLRAVGLGEAQS